MKHILAKETNNTWTSTVFLLRRGKCYALAKGKPGNEILLAKLKFKRKGKMREVKE